MNEGGGYRRTPTPGSADHGKALEHLVMMELRAFSAYRAPDLDLRFIRTAGGVEVDFVLGDMDLAIAVKSGRRVHDGDLRAFGVLRDEASVRRCAVVCQEDTRR